MFPHHSGFDLIGLCDDRRGFPRWAVQVLDALLVIVTQLQRVWEAVEGGHDGSVDQGVLEAKNMAKLMGRHLQEVRAWGTTMGHRTRDSDCETEGFNQTFLSKI